VRSRSTAGRVGVYLPAVPRVRPLRTYNLPDIGDHLIHFTGRLGGRFMVPDDIRDLSPSDRLAQILHEFRIRAIPTFGTGMRAIVAFTESSQASVLRLISEGRYTPWGIGFSKQFIFDQGGGPVLYVRGDQWEATTAVLPDPVRAHAVRFWPGATWEEGDPIAPDGVQWLPDAIANESEWLHEREWRVPHDVVFDWGDVKFLIVPAPDWAALQAHQYGIAYGNEYEQHFAGIPLVAIDETGQLLHDGSGIWAGNN
jgi:hypothetical protein